MKEIQILSTPNSKSKYDEGIGHYMVKKEGESDIVVLCNYRHKEIKQIRDDNEVVRYNAVEVSSDEEYVVKPLDSINKIATKFNVDAQEIIRKNNLKDDRLFIGQILKI